MYQSLLYIVAILDRYRGGPNFKQGMFSWDIPYHMQLYISDNFNLDCNKNICLITLMFNDKLKCWRPKMVTQPWIWQKHKKSEKYSQRNEFGITVVLISFYRCIFYYTNLWNKYLTGNCAEMDGWQNPLIMFIQCYRYANIIMKYHC